MGRLLSKSILEILHCILFFPEQEAQSAKVEAGNGIRTLDTAAVLELELSPEQWTIIVYCV